MSKGILKPTPEQRAGMKALAKLRNVDVSLRTNAVPPKPKATPKATK